MVTHTTTDYIVGRSLLLTTSHQTTLYYNSCCTYAFSRPPPFLPMSSLVSCPIQQTTHALHLFPNLMLWKHRLNHLPSLVLSGYASYRTDSAPITLACFFEVIDRVIEQLWLVAQYQTCETPRHKLVLEWWCLNDSSLSRGEQTKLV